MTVEALRTSVTEAPLIYRKESVFFADVEIPVHTIEECNKELKEIYESKDLTRALSFAYKYMPFKGCVSELAAYLYNDLAIQIGHLYRVSPRLLNSLDTYMLRNLYYQKDFSTSVMQRIRNKCEVFNYVDTDEFHLKFTIKNNKEE